MEYWDVRAHWDRFMWETPLLSRFTRKEYSSALELLRRSRFTRNNVILHLACGTKSEVWCDHPGNIIHLDHSRSMLVQARQADPQRIYVRADTYTLPFRNQSLSAIVAIGLTEYVSDVDAWMKEMSRIMAPKGVMIFSFSQPNTTNNIRRLWNGSKIYLRRVSEWETLLNAVRFTVEEVRELTLQTQIRCIRN